MGVCILRGLKVRIVKYGQAWIVDKGGLWVKIFCQFFGHLVVGTNNSMISQNLLVKQLPYSLSAKLHKSSQHLMSSF